MASDKRVTNTDHSFHWIPTFNYAVLSTTEKPTLVTLEQFPCEIKGDRPNIVAIVATHYRPIGTLLLDDKDGSKVDNIEREALRNPEETMRGIFKTWLKQDTDCSWEKFINFLRQVKLNVFAKDIEDALRECKEPTEGV